MPEASVIQEKVNCYHCGEQCEDREVYIEDKFFCCEGCKMVYEILQSSDMCTYYDLEQNPGISLKNLTRRKDYSFLDQDGIREKILDFQEGNLAMATFRISQMHCTSCIWLLENLYKLTPGVSQSRVNFLKKELYVTFDIGIIPLSGLAGLLSSIGYEPEINLQNLKGREQKHNNRSFYYRLGIAGFCFGNIMLLSFPEYLGMDRLLDADYSRFFGLLNFILVLPVFLYSGFIFYRSAYLGLRHGNLNIDVPITLGIAVLFARSAYEVFSGTGPGYFDSLAGLVFFLLAGRWFQNKTYDDLSFERDYESYFPVAAMRKEGDAEESVPVTQLKEGDRIVVRNQELIPADAILMSREANIDYSFVTGESIPVRKEKGDLIYGGGRHNGAAIELDLVKEVSQSYLTRLWNDEAFGEARHSRLISLADRFSKYFTFIILLIALAAGAWWMQVDTDTAVNVVTAVLIVACPCALALSAPITLGHAQRILGRNRFFLKSANVVEQLSIVSHIVFDKTGTLTRPGHQELEFEGDPLSSEEADWVKSLTRHSTHPVSRWIYQGINGSAGSEIDGFEEISGAGVSGGTKGHRIRLGSAEFAGNTANTTNGTTGAWLSIDGQLRGSFRMQNRYREGLDQLVSQLSSFGSVSMVSGDNEGERSRVGAIFPAGSELHFNQSPHDKLEYIRSIQENGETVLMVGDGLNDAGALKKSDVGIAVSEDINHFLPSCDAILESSNFSFLADFLGFSKQSMNIVKGGFAMSLAYNLIGLSFAVQGALSPLVAAILMPVSSVSVVLFATIATNLSARKRGLFRANP